MFKSSKIAALGVAVSMLLPPAASFAYFAADFGLEPGYRPSTREIREAQHDRNHSANDTITDDDNESSSNNVNPRFLGLFVEPRTNSVGVTATFDIRAFRSHECYNAVGVEHDYCLRALGVSGDFGPMIEDDTLSETAIRSMLDARCNKVRNSQQALCRKENDSLLPQLLADVHAIGNSADNNEPADTAQENGASQRMNRRERMVELWDACTSHPLTRAGCYQQFIRVITDESVDMSDVRGLILQAKR